MAPDRSPRSLVALRVLDGPNLYFPRPAVRVVLRPVTLLEAPEDEVRAVARRLGVRGAVVPDGPGSERRLFVVARIAEASLRNIARRAGGIRLGVRSRPDVATGEIVVAFPWRRRGKAEALARELARVLDGAGGADLEARLDAAGAAVADAPDGGPPRVVVPRVPTVAVTGTNGKTTVTRMVAHMAACAGETPGWCTSDGVYIAGELVDRGDLTGFVGTTTVLGHPDVTFAVLETARGGILRRGIGATTNDVAVVTNVSADHLGLGGINTLDQLAEVKATILRITRSTGWAVLNVDDPRVAAMRTVTKAGIFGFSLDPASPALRAVLDEGGRGATVVDAQIVILGWGEPEPLCRVEHVPMTIAGLSQHNVANALAAAGAGLVAGLPRAAVVQGLMTFRPDPISNPGRLNLWDVDGRLVIVDYGHNEEGLRALLQVARALCPPERRVRLVLNAVGDRTDEILEGMGELACRGSDQVVIAERESSLRGRTHEEFYGLLRRGLAITGCREVPSAPSEVEAAAFVLDAADAGDVCAVMCHDRRDEMNDWLVARGGATIDPAVARARASA